MPHDILTWRGLELLDQIASDRVCEFVTTWPDNVVIEVRRCPCGQVTARKAREDDTLVVARRR
jgi:hypothetical protein